MYENGSNIGNVSDCPECVSYERELSRLKAMRKKHERTSAAKRLAGLIDDMLNQAQRIRIVQMQSHIEQRAKDNADTAWSRLNDAHRAATELLQSEGGAW